MDRNRPAADVCRSEIYRYVPDPLCLLRLMYFSGWYRPELLPSSKSMLWSLVPPASARAGGMRVRTEDRFAEAGIVPGLVRMEMPEKAGTSRTARKEGQL